MLTTIIISIFVSVIITAIIMVAIVVVALRTFGNMEEKSLRHNTKLNTLILIDSLIKSGDTTLIETGRRMHQHLNELDLLHDIDERLTKNS
ncbi:hypothetical protein C6P11_06170 [Weissella confusa]|uniref:Uncharacterized protein n=1 Tax=Weissella confusa TaxID=1583 RepID=A0A4Z0RYV4_WEICO|nr:hypothetical protein C6P11_06170 [Weissella confusa]